MPSHDTGSSLSGWAGIGREAIGERDDEVRAVHRSDTRAEELAKQLQEVQAEREELVIAERVLNRLAEQDPAEAETAATVAPTPARVAGRAVLLIPHRRESRRGRAAR